MATRDIAPQGDNEGSIGTAAKKWANVQSVLTNDLTLAKQATGFTIAGGTTSKTLTVDETVALSAKANLTSPALVTPNLGTPSAGVLSSCTTATAADNTATTALASTAFAKSQDAVLARLPDQAVNMTAAASGSSGITVADNDNIDFGTGGFSLAFNGSLPSWTASSILLQKLTGGVGYQLETVVTTGYLKLTLNALTFTTTIAPSFVAGTSHSIVVIVSVGLTQTTVSFYVDGILLETPAAQNNTTTVSSAALLYALGTSAVRTSGTCSFAATYNRALTAAEVLDLYRNGISYADKWGAQTAITSGTLVVGYKYRINTYVSDDDFTNIGGTNVTGNEFIATGTTPTHWAHSSSLVKTGATLALEPEGIQNNLWYDSSSNNLNASYPATGWSLTRKLNVPRVNTAQPAFLAYLNTSVSNVTGDNTNYTVLFDTVVYNIGSGYNTSTGVFTAPITGKYLFTAFATITTAGGSTGFYIIIQTSNRTTYGNKTGGIATDLLTYSTVMDMDAGDVCYVGILCVGGSKIAGIQGHATYLYSTFSGSLIC